MDAPSEAATIADDDAPAIETAEAGATIDGDSGAAIDGEAGGRRRRRRRRRRRGGGASESVAAAPITLESSDEGNDEGEGEGDDDEPTSEAAADSTTETDDEGRKRRRRRRRGRRRNGAPEATAPATPAQVVVAPEQPIPQDEIVIDIDESELEIVRDAFGEIDELDDFTLKGRRRGVLDTLAEEVELEDLTGKDTPPPAAAASAEASDEDEADAAADSTSEGEIEAESDGDEADGDAAADDPNKRKRKRRRRRKKKADAEPTPALMAPPHKDFWEVWASHFSYRDFEVEPAVPEVVEPVRATHHSQVFADEPESNDHVDDDIVTVRLNLGRSHDKKAANIRDLLAERAGVTGRAVKNLTVGDRDTEFQIGRSLCSRLERSLVGTECDGVSLTVVVVDDEAGSAADDEGQTNAPIDVVDEAAVHAAEEPSDTAPVT